MEDNLCYYLGGAAVLGVMSGAWSVGRKHKLKTKNLILLTVFMGLVAAGVIILKAYALQYVWKKFYPDRPISLCDSVIFDFFLTILARAYLS